MTRLLRLGLGVAAVGGALVLIDWRAVTPLLSTALSRAFSRQALTIAVLGQVASLAACAAGLRVLASGLPAVGAFLSRGVRDAVGALPAGLPGLGEAAGVRILSLFGVSATAAVAITAADVLAETIAQALYALSATALAPSSLRVPAPHVPAPAVGLLLAAAVVLGAAVALLVKFAPRAWRRSLASVLSLVGASLKSRRFGASLGLHGLAWVMGGVQVFLLARAIGAPLTVLQGLSLEGLVFALRAAFFFVPAGAGVQEIGLAAIGAGYGLAPADTAALALLLRLRDLVALTPMLIAWGVLEGRAALGSVAGPAAPTPGHPPCA